MQRVVILQEYIPEYRVPFFNLLREKARQVGIEVEVAYGKAGFAQASRNDARHLDFGIEISQREWRIAGRRVVTRDIADAIAGADMVILEQARRNLDAYKLLLPRPHRTCLIALWGHGKDYTRDTSAMDRTISRWLTSKADWFFAYTSGGKEAVTRDGYPANRLSVVKNSIDTQVLRADVTSVRPSEIHDYSRRMGLHGKTALFIGALDGTKRLDFLHQAGQIANDLDPGFRLLVAGEGSLQPQVEEWARRHYWLKYLGAVSGPDKALAMASSEILAVPGRVGLVAVDSFAAARPIVTTDWPWHAPEFEYLGNGENAIVTRDDRTAYGSAMVDLLNDRSLLIQLQEAAARCAADFTIEVMAENFLRGMRCALLQRKS